MNDPRKPIGWLLVALVGALAVGMAALGVLQSPSGQDALAANVSTAVANTLHASSYTEDATITESGVTRQYHLVFQAPDRLAGWVSTKGSSSRSYVVLIGNTQYVATATKGARYRSLHFSKSSSPQTAAQTDFAQLELALVDQSVGGVTRTVTQNGSTYLLTYRQGSKVAGTARYELTGPYVSRFTFVRASPAGRFDLHISQVDSSPPVQLPTVSHTSG